MPEDMVAISRIRRCLVVAGLAASLAACSVPGLHHTVVVQTNSEGIPVHASGQMNGDSYTVVRGDTLYSIAFRANVDYHQLAAWNGISAPYVIHPGQVLSVAGPAPAASAQTAAPAPAPVFQTVTTSGQTVAPASAPAAAKPAAAGATASTATGSATEVVAVAGKAPVASHAPVDSGATNISVGATRTVAGIAWSWPAQGKLVSGFNASDAIPGIDIAGKVGEPVRAAADGVVVYSGNGLVGYGELIIIKHSDNYLSAYGHNSKRLVKEGDHVKAGEEIALMGASGAPRNELGFQIRYKGKPVDPLKYLPANGG